MKKIIAFLLCFFVFTTVKAQGTLVKEANTLKVIASLQGKTFGESETILKNYGLKFYESEKDETNNLESYFFVPENDKKPEFAAQYSISCKNNKVVTVVVSYEYDEDEIRVLANDRTEIIKQLTSAGFIPGEKKKDTKLKVFVNKSNAAYIYSDLELMAFSLTIGDAKLVDLIMAVE